MNHQETQQQEMQGRERPMEQSGENRTANRKSRLKYAAGILALTATVVLALFLPVWYSDWQDARIFSEVALLHREPIQFLDTELLDITARLKALAESEGFGYYQGGDTMYGYGFQRNYGQELWETIKGTLKKWEAYHLMPEGFADDIRDMDLLWTDSYYAELDDGLIPVTIMSFQRKEGFGQDYDLQLIVDQETGFPYYVELTGEGAMRYLMEDCLRLSNSDDVIVSMEDGMYSLDKARDFSWYGFTQAAGAEAQEPLMNDPTGMYQIVKLAYEDFDGIAARELVSNNANGGFGIWFGRESWRWMANDLVNLRYGKELENYNYIEWSEEWNWMVSEAGREDLRIPESIDEVLDYERLDALANQRNAEAGDVTGTSAYETEAAKESAWTEKEGKANISVDVDNAAASNNY